MTSSNDIREAFLRFFEQRGHTRVESGPLVPPNDPTLMFTNAGMVQFKDVFTGKESRAYRRATTSQKCIRISGKHNDLENVGFTARHHTFFEMLGNFSFGDYFKADAIAFGWAFVTEVLGLPPDRLVVSVFGGEGALPADTEAEALFADVAKVPKARIVRCGADDNFWSMGDTGPCGPCAEIHYFAGKEVADPASFGQEPTPDGQGWVELWNLVFMQYEKHADGSFTDLPAPSIDTGAGLERLSAVAQGVRSNYDTDLLRPIVDLSADISQKPYRGSLDPDDVSMRVIADHARTTAFMISEGIFPENEGRAYVLRRVMRRAIRHGHRLGIERPFLHECAGRVADVMGTAYPQLTERRALIEDIARQEEERFRRTLRRGLDLLEANQRWEERQGKRVLPGSVAFELFGTYGFPVDLQEVLGQEAGFDVDRAGFKRELEKEKTRSRGGSRIEADAAVAAVYRELEGETGPSAFTGYESCVGSDRVAALVSQGARTERLAAGQQGELFVRSTPFYAEAGGQVGDQGEIVTASGVFRVRDTQKPVGGLIAHHGVVEEGSVRVGEAAQLRVDERRRAQVRRNHSATHLLHYALRTVLGPQAMQKGSRVAPDRLRFDYAAARPLTAQELRRVEDLVNEKIWANGPIETEVLPMDEAKAKGAIGIFEEKYGAVVRMLRMTDDSIELCGGTHAERTGDLGVFTIVSDASLAAGVRRIEALTGAAALAHLRAVSDEFHAVSALLKAGPGQAVDKTERLLTTQRDLQKQVEGLRRKLVSGGTADLTAGAKNVDGVTFLGTTVDLDDPKALRELADQLRDRLAPSVVLLGAGTGDGKALLACTVSKDLLGRFHAGKLVKAAAAKVGGGGGGRPDFAQAGGSNPAALAEAVATVYGAMPGG